jgi:hypothetical protein
MTQNVASGESGFVPPHTKKLARGAMTLERREASWSAPVLRRFSFASRRTMFSTSSVQRFG